MDGHGLWCWNAARAAGSRLMCPCEIRATDEYEWLWVTWLREALIDPPCLSLELAVVGRQSASNSSRAGTSRMVAPPLEGSVQYAPIMGLGCDAG